MRYDQIIEPHLEHIAPQTENCEPNNGYCTYDEEFYNEYLERLGNYLLISGHDNISLGNQSFQNKRERYTQLRQQAKVREMTISDLTWDKEKIRKRHEEIVSTLLPSL